MKTTECPKCHQQIRNCSYNRHFMACDGTGVKHFIKQTEPDSLNCQYCQRLCKNLNSLRQHELRCAKNPERRDFEKLLPYAGKTKGLTAETSDIVKKYTTSLRKGFEEGKYNTHRPKKWTTQLYQEHNESEIQKWLDYINSINICIPDYDILSKKHNEGYVVISHQYVKCNNSCLLTFEHNFIMNAYLQGALLKENTVHHINGVRDDNRITNLITFVNSASHKRFHTSQYAYLIYNNETHLFDCQLKKD